MLRVGVCRVAFVVLIAVLAPASSGPAAPADSWDSLADDFIDHYFAFNPTVATNAGVHSHDSELEDYSAQAIAKQVAWFQQFEKRVLAFDPSSLNRTDAADRDILLNSIRADLLALQVIRVWQKDPDTYS